MAKLMDAQYHELLSESSRFKRYLTLSSQTWKIFKSKQYDTIFVQNPSIVLAFIGVILGRIFGVKVVVDAHNAGVYPAEGKSKVLSAIVKFIAHRATMTIVSNEHLVKEVESWGAKAFSMVDPLPELEEFPESNDKQDFDVLFVCTWAEDEPYHEVIKAAESLPEVTIAVTGNYKKIFAEHELDQLPKNINLTGFVSEERYLELLTTSKVVVDLTTRENCLVCGAYESISAEKPCILSDTKVNREVFTMGFIYTQNNAEAIAAAIKTALEGEEQLNQDISTAKKTFLAAEKVRSKEFFAVIETLT